MPTRTPYSLGSSSWSGSAWRWPTGGGRRGRFPFARSLTSLALGRCRGGLEAAPPSADAARDVISCRRGKGVAPEVCRLRALCFTSTWNLLLSPLQLALSHRTSARYWNWP